ncbi:protein yls9, partial [Phtheirospermum japonicum]
EAVGRGRVAAGAFAAAVVSFSSSSSSPSSPCSLPTVCTIPSSRPYSVQNLQVKAFNVQPDFTLKTELELSVRAENPNKHIGFFYGDDNLVEVAFKEVRICSGKVPGFHQGTENKTVIKFDLKGNTAVDPGLQRAFNESQSKHWIPLVVKLRVPVNIMLGESLLREIRAFVICTLVVDNLAPNSTDVKILSRETHVHFEL